MHVHSSFFLLISSSAHASFAAATILIELFRNLSYQLSFNLTELSVALAWHVYALRLWIWTIIDSSRDIKSLFFRFNYFSLQLISTHDDIKMNEKRFLALTKALTLCEFVEEFVSRGVKKRLRFDSQQLQSPSGKNVALRRMWTKLFAHIKVS